MSDRLNWGILGTGNIARQFCAGANASRRGRLAAVGSRTTDAARTFAAAHQIPVAHGSYDALLADPAVHAVYVSLPNSLHHEWTIKALRAGKHVLCEKPIAVDAAEAAEMFAVAASLGLTLVEAFMYRSHPLTDAVLRAVRGGAIGRVQLVRTSFCYRTTKVAGNVRFDPALAGGGLMDVGCYCVNFSCLIAGEEPSRVFAAAQMHERGVDHVATGMLQFPAGTLASFTCGMSVEADNTAYVCGTEGYVEIPIPWKPPAAGATYHVVHATPPRMDAPGPAAVKSAPNSGPRETYTVDAGLDLYGLEADDFAATVLDGAPQRVTAGETLTVMRVLDEMRCQTRVIQ